MTPTGLWSDEVDGAPTPRRSARPSTAMTTPPGSTGWPSVAGRPSTVTRPAAISRSAARREATPAAARTFWSRSGPSAGQADRDAGAVGGRPSPRSLERRPRRRRRCRLGRLGRGLDEPGGDLGSSGGRSSRHVSPKRSRNSKPVPYRIGRPGALGAAQLDDRAGDGAGRAACSRSRRRGCARSPPA